MRIFLKRLSLVIIGLFCVAQISHAHRFFASFTQIDLRDNKQVIEVVHRLFTHDVEDFLRLKLGNLSGLTDAEIEPVLRAYVESGFALFDAGGNRLPLDWVGMEYEIDNVHIYQETPLPADPAQLMIINRLFLDLFDNQKNTVNVAWQGKIRTGIFVKGKEQQKISFTEAD